MRVAFAGTPVFAAAALGHLIAAGFDLVLVLTQPDRPAGRGLKLQASPVKQLSQARGLPIAQPRSLRLDGKYPDDALAARAALDAARPDVMVVAAYGLILPPWVLALPRLGCLNIHASLLPRWRGAAPIQRAIEAGDVTTGITIMQMDTGLDTGDVLLAEEIAIAPGDTAATLHDRLAESGGRLIVKALDAAAHEGLVPKPQPEAGVTYARKIDKSEAAIDWRRPAAEIERRIRAFDPAPGCHFEFAGELLKVWRADVSAGFSNEPGKVDRSDSRVRVACGDGLALDLIEVQRPGGRRMAASALLATRVR
ncbi:MAG: methionyl-tRNA formyltransferase [Aquincola sp.]|nr:methionyl-tRNA formyltransferase [Aquincola sp.]MDH5329341.1 methionyl-tRNA formyltransferase [Aquincola sp.]